MTATKRRTRFVLVDFYSSDQFCFSLLFLVFFCFSSFLPSSVFHVNQLTIPLQRSKPAHHIPSARHKQYRPVPQIPTRIPAHIYSFPFNSSAFPFASPATSCVFPFASPASSDALPLASPVNFSAEPSALLALMPMADLMDSEACPVGQWIWRLANVIPERKEREKGSEGYASRVAPLV